MMDWDPHPRSEYLLRNLVRILDPIRLAALVDVVQESEQPFANSKSTLDGC